MKVLLCYFCIGYLVSAKVINSPIKVEPSTTTSTVRPAESSKPPVPVVTPSEEFLHKLQLDTDGAYWVFWNKNETHITFETHVKTHGYVGFGLSGSGKMFPGDVVIGWVKDGVTYFKDCHTVGHVMPVEDESQDWILIEGEENDKGTRLKFTRKIDTCDANDFRITDETIRVVFAYHPEDPVSMTSLPWHGAARRGTKSVLLLSSSALPEVPLQSNAKYIDVVKSNYHVPAVGTTYHCTTFRLPKLSEKNHIVKYEPYVQEGNELHVHHIVIYTIPKHVDSRYDNLNYDCTWGKNTPQALHGREVFLVWAVGGRVQASSLNNSSVLPIVSIVYQCPPGLTHDRGVSVHLDQVITSDHMAVYFPEDAGLSIGMPEDPDFFILETHYDNPTLKADIVDSSGIRFTYTPSLRQHDAGVIYASLSVSPIQIVPPYETDFHSKAECSRECLEQVLPEEGVNVFAVFQHAHLLAKGITTHHFRNDTELKPFAHDSHYDFNYQDVRILSPEQKLMKGDSIMVECAYNSEHKTKVTNGGLSTEEEMCISTLLYYPRMPLAGCGSAPLYEAVNSTDVWAAVNTINTWDWTKPSVRNHFRSVLENSDTKLYCNGPLLKDSDKLVTRKLEVPTKRYTLPPRNCPEV